MIELNDRVWCTLMPSDIHGVGVFAIRDIPKGQRVYCRERERRIFRGPPHKEMLDEIVKIVRQRYPYADEGGDFQDPNGDACLIVFMNHSTKPNYDYKTDSTLRDIRTGEEITEDYEQFAPH